jgi:hypothetical protein
MERRKFVQLAGMATAAVAILGKDAFAGTAKDAERQAIIAHLEEHLNWPVPKVEYVIKQFQQHKTDLRRARVLVQQIPSLDSAKHIVELEGYVKDRIWTAGWKAEWDGTTYGDFIKVDDPYSDEIWLEIKQLLDEQARDTHYMLYRKFPMPDFD